MAQASQLPAPERAPEAQPGRRCVLNPDDAARIERYLKEEPQTLVEVEGWVLAAARPFRRRLAADWEDAVQEGRLAIAALLSRGAFRGEASLKTYVWRVAAHACLAKLRARSRRSWVGIEDFECSSDEPSPLDRLIHCERERLLLAVLHEMSEECRRLWEMIIEGLSYRDMSQTLGVAAGALRVRALRCRRRAVEVRQRLESNGV